VRPLYYQIAYGLSNKIKNGEFKPGDLIPSETQLSAEYGASKMTVRQGLTLLSDAGYLKTVPGKGNYVDWPRYDIFTVRFNEMEITGGAPGGVKLLEVNMEDPTPEIRQHLNLLPGGKTVVVKRLLYTEGNPSAYDVKYLPYEKGKPVVEREIQNVPFPEMVAKHGELFSVKNEVSISAAAANQECAQKLGVEPSSPLLVVEQKLYSADHKVIGWGKTFCHCDYFRLEAISSQYQRNQVLHKF